jgi:hypothetical protein
MDRVRPRQAARVPDDFVLVPDRTLIVSQSSDILSMKGDMMTVISDCDVSRSNRLGVLSDMQLSKHR